MKCLFGDGAHDVRVTGVDNREDSYAEVLTTGGTEVGVVARVVVYTGLGKHGVVLDLGLTKGRAVVGDDDELGFARAKGLEGGLVAKGGLARLHYKLKTGVDGLHGLLGLLGGYHDV